MNRWYRTLLAFVSLQRGSMMNRNDKTQRIDTNNHGGESERHRQLERELREHAHQLEERVKELNCLYAISSILEDPGTTFEEKMNALVAALPSGWHYPSITTAQVVLADATYAMPNFRKTPWLQSGAIQLHGETVGALNIAYLEERPTLDEGPFLNEERSLLDAIAGRIALFYERRVAYRQLQESETRYRTFIENIPIAACRSTPGKNGNILMANSRMVKMFGYESSEALLQIHACDLYKYPTQRGVFSQSLLKQGDVVVEEVEMKRRDGSAFRVRLSGSVIGTPPDEVPYFDCFMEDITEKHRGEQENKVLEEQLRNTVMDAIVTVSDSMTVLSANDAAMALFAKTDEPLEGENFHALCEETLSDIAEITENAMRNGEFVRDAKVNVYREGVESTYSLSVTTLQSKQSVRGIVVIEDITRILDLERQISGKFPAVSIVGKSAAMTDVFELILDVADTSSTVLIEGESGTGKELVSSAIHHQSPRKRGPFVRVNCVSLTETLLESELFGHVRGAFTGATRDKAGRFELAHGGTIFLDEIGDISPTMQQHLLRVLQEREIERVGSTKTIKVDVRVVAATNKSLADLVAAGRFREDLYYRLNVFRIEVPPLRDRREDIPLLLNHFVRRIKKRTNREIKGILPETMQTMMQYDWPGNVRQLENALERAAVMSRDGFIHPNHLPPEVSPVGASAVQVTPTQRGAVTEESLRLTLQESGWNRTQAAHRLGVSRSTLWRMMKKLDVQHPTQP